MTVRLDPAADGPTNMRLDLELLQLAEGGELSGRVYSWRGPWVSLGKFQRPEVDLIGPIQYVIRPTGGKAVLHGHDSTIGLAAPLEILGCTARDVKKAYRCISKPIVEALRRCGLESALAEETRFVGSGLKTADCFAFNSPNDIVDERTGKKVCGCALMLTQTAVLLQASIPNGKPVVDPTSVLREASDYIGPEWDASGLAGALEEALRYNNLHVRA